MNTKALVLALVVLAVIGWVHLADVRSGRAGGANVWASPRHLKALRVKGPGKGRLVVGRMGRHLIATAERTSLLVLGATETLKSTGCCTPAVLEWNGPALVVSVKADLVRDTLARRSEMGTVWVYDPFATSGLPCSLWSPLAVAGTWAGAERAAEWISEAAKAGPGGPGGDKFWDDVSAMMLAPLLFAAATGKLGMAEVVSWVRRQEIAEPRQLITATGNKEALEAFCANYRREERQLSGILTTTERMLRPWADPAIAASLKGSEISARKLLEGNNTIYVCAPSDEQDRFEAVFSTLVRQIITVAMHRGVKESLDPPLLVVLDEAANIAPVRNLPALASTAAAHGVQLVTVFQDLSQIRARYGDDGAETIVNNHRAKVVLGGGSDRRTLELVSTLIGDAPEAQQSSTRGNGRPTTTESTTYRPVAPPEFTRSIEPGNGLLIYGHRPVAKIRLRPWFADRALRRLAGVEKIRRRGPWLAALVPRRLSGVAE